MATSNYFNNYGSIAEQRVIEDIIIESIKIMGFDAYYCPNDNDIARDLLYGEDPVKKFQSAFPLEMYLSSDPLDYQGQQEFFSKFGLEIKDSVNVMVSRRSFAQRVPQNTFTRPREGDLIYIPFLNGTGELYEITFTEQAKDLAMLGRRQPYFYDLKLEKFKYSQELIETGIEDIDHVVNDSAYMIKLLTDVRAGNNYTNHEIVYQSADTTEANATAVAIVQSWDAPTQELMVSNIAGEFIGNVIIYGASSNSQRILVSFDPLLDNAFNETYSNKLLQTEASSIIDFSEENPFGNI